MENPIKMDDLGYHYFWKHPIPSKITWDLTNGPRSGSCNRAFLDTQVFSGSLVTVGPKLEISWINLTTVFYKKKTSRSLCKKKEAQLALWKTHRIPTQISSKKDTSQTVHQEKSHKLRENSQKNLQGTVFLERKLARRRPFSTWFLLPCLGGGTLPSTSVESSAIQNWTKNDEKGTTTDSKEMLFSGWWLNQPQTEKYAEVKLDHFPR